MTPRPRKNKNKGLPQNLYKAGDYFQYKHPITGKYHGMGKDKAEAITAANVLNGHLMNKKSTVDRVLGLENITIKQVIKDFKSDFLPERHYAESTLEEIGYKLNHIQEWLKETDIKMVDTRMCASWLDTYERRAYQQHRKVLIDVFKVAIAKGYMSRNPASDTLLKSAPKQRQRLTEKQYKAIYELAAPWFKNVMDLALITLQRRSDLAVMKFDDIKDGFLWVDQIKNRRHKNKASRIKIPLDLPGLKAVLSRCRDDVVCPFIIHKQPERRNRWKGQEHWAQVTKASLSREFAKLRDKTGMFDHLNDKEKPTLHELRSLGGDIYDKKYGDNFTQSLYGHTTKKMSDKYREGHENWTEIEFCTK